MRPVVDESLCIGCGTCEELCPDVFEVGDDGFSHVIAADPARACADSGLLRGGGRGVPCGRHQPRRRLSVRPVESGRSPAIT